MILPQQPIQAVVFDLDGLMFNTEALYVEVAEHLLHARGKVVTPALLDEMMGRPSPVSLQIMIDRMQLTATVAQLQQETEEVFPAILDRSLQTMPGLLELLDAIDKAKLPKAIATSSRRVFAERVLGQFDLAGRFAFVLTCEDVTCGKPAPEVYWKAARRLDVSPERVMVLEDSQNGCRAAVAAGTYAVAVPGDHSRNHDFTGAAFVADGLSDLQIYKALGQGSGIRE